MPAGTGGPVDRRAGRRLVPRAPVSAGRAGTVRPAGRGVPVVAPALASAGRGGVRRTARAPAVGRCPAALRGAAARAVPRAVPVIVARRSGRVAPPVDRARVVAGRATARPDAAAARRATGAVSRADGARASRRAGPAAATIGRRVPAAPSRREAARRVASPAGGRSKGRVRRIDRTGAGRRTVRRERARGVLGRGASPLPTVTVVAEAAGLRAALVGPAGTPRSKPGRAAGTARDATTTGLRRPVRATWTALRGPAVSAVTVRERTNVVRVAASSAGGRVPGGVPRATVASARAVAAGRVGTRPVVRSVAPRRAATSVAAMSAAVRRVTHGPAGTSVAVLSAAARPAGTGAVRRLVAVVSVAARPAATSGVRRQVAVRGPRGRGATAPSRAPVVTAARSGAVATVHDRPTAGMSSGASAEATAAVSAASSVQRGVRRRPGHGAVVRSGARGGRRVSGPIGRRGPTDRSTRSSPTTSSSASWIARSAAGCAR